MPVQKNPEAIAEFKRRHGKPGTPQIFRGGLGEPSEIGRKRSRPRSARAGSP